MPRLERGTLSCYARPLATRPPPPLTAYITLQLTAHYIDIPHTHIINLCLQQGCFLDAKVIPIFKSGDDNDENIYGPTSILPPISKVFEKAVAQRFTGFFWRISNYYLIIWIS